MIIEIKFQDDVPMGMAKILIAALHGHIALFCMAVKMKVSFEPGEAERLIAVENAPRISTE